MQTRFILFAHQVVNSISPVPMSTLFIYFPCSFASCKNCLLTINLCSTVASLLIFEARPIQFCSTCPWILGSKDKTTEQKTYYYHWYTGFCPYFAISMMTDNIMQIELGNWLQGETRTKWTPLHTFGASVSPLHRSNDGIKGPLETDDREEQQRDVKTGAFNAHHIFCFFRKTSAAVVPGKNDVVPEEG